LTSVVGWKLSGLERRYASNQASHQPLSSSSKAVIPEKTPIQPSSSFLSPPEAFKYLISAGVSKVSRSPSTIFLASFLGGAYLSFGGLLSFTIAGGSAAALPAGVVSLLAGIVFPVGLAMITFSGTDLLTGNMLYGTMPFYELKRDELSGSEGTKAVSDLIKILGISLLGNLVGSGSMALAVSLYGGVAQNAAVASWISSLAAKKCALPWAASFFRGIGANWVG
jgi:formate/nitrite transporter FocA (FNT family)